MSQMIRNIVSNYNEILESNKDPLVDTWLLMSSPTPLLFILATYLCFVLKVGPKIMEKRPAFELNKLMILYNFCQVVFSIWLAQLTFRVNFSLNIFTNFCSTESAKNRDFNVQTPVSVAAWWYFFSKITELLDTVFFVLRKKQNQVSFLHVYHHSITALFSWCYLKLMPGEQGVLLGVLNSLVHVVMYSYYLIAALGPRFKKYLWWKKYMTWIQLIQFGIMLGYLMLTLLMDCRMSKALTYFFLTNVVIFIYLFTDFYRKAYKKQKMV